jgi:hypothetical protein
MKYKVISVNGPELPDQTVIITDDAMCQTFLVAEGLLTKLSRELPEAADLPAAGDEAQTVICKHHTHATHWILAMALYDNKNPGGNGFIIIGWPKKKWPAEVMDDYLNRQGYTNPR